MGEEKCLRDKVRLMPQNFDLVRKRVLEIFREPVPLAKGVKKRALVKYVIRIDKVYNYVDSAVFSFIDNVPKPEELNEFYVEILRLSGINDYGDMLHKFRGYRRVLRKLWLNYRSKIKTTLTRREAFNLSREFVGRALSVVRRLRKDLELMRNALIELRKLPCINLNEPLIVIAGMPQVGKSTLVRRISTAEPEVSPFPFTTKEVILGHIVTHYTRIQVLDTPGILDRPLSELNDIERKAVAAIRWLGNILIYLIDPRKASYYPLSDQLELLKTIENIFRGKHIIVAINKIDDVDRGRLSEVTSKVKEVFKGEIFLISALKGIGVNELLKRVIDLIATSSTLL